MEQLADREPGPVGVRPRQDRADLLRLREPACASWKEVPTWSRTRPEPRATRSTTLEAPPHLAADLHPGRVGGDVRHLAEPGAFVVLEHDVAAALQGQAVQGGLELEGHSVHGRRQRQDSSFDVLPDVPVARDPVGQPVGCFRHALTVLGDRGAHFPRDE